MNFEFKVNCTVTNVNGNLHIKPCIESLESFILNKNEFNIEDDSCIIFLESNLKFSNGELSKLNANEILDKKRRNRISVVSLKSDSFCLKFSRHHLNMIPFADKIIKDDLLEYIREEATTKYEEVKNYSYDNWTRKEAELALIFYLTTIHIATSDLKKEAEKYAQKFYPNRTPDALLFKCAGFKRLHNNDESSGLGNFGKVFQDVWFDRNKIIDKYKNA